MKRSVIGVLLLMLLAFLAAPTAAEVEQVVIKVTGALNCVF
jgi:hypothetical protein